MTRSVGRLALAATLVTLAPPGLAAQQAGAMPRLPVQKFTLPNGLEVILHEDHSVPLVTVNVWYKVGSSDEQPGRTGFAHLFEHVMFMGSQNVPVGKYDEWLEAVGASPNGSTSQDRTNYYQGGSSTALPLMLWLEADRMGALLPTMSQDKLDVQRDVVKNERRQSYDNVPYGRAWETILRTLYPLQHPYSWPVIGSMEDLSAASLADVNSFFRMYYAPNNASVSIAGDFAPDSARAWVTRYFGAIPRGPAMPPRPMIADARVVRDTAIMLEDRVQLPRVYWAWHTARAFHPDDAALDLLAYVLAGDKNSRLYKRLVYDLQVAQSVGARQSSGRLAGSFLVDVTPRPGQDPSAVARIVEEEISRLATGGVTEEEMTRARNTFLSRMLNSLASVQGKADQLQYYNYFVGTPDYVQEDAARYASARAEDVQRVARQYLSESKVLLTVVPQGKPEMMVQMGAGN
ncbi:MAG: insulinase family protein [Gemmatimonadaceae bacterium]|nr:insulinase family protein [Gemmatimonadaceae bacterium]